LRGDQVADEMFYIIGMQALMGADAAAPAGMPQLPPQGPGRDARQAPREEEEEEEPLIGDVIGKGAFRILAVEILNQSKIFPYQLPLPNIIKSGKAFAISGKVPTYRHYSKREIDAILKISNERGYGLSYVLGNTDEPPGPRRQIIAEDITRI
jgi:hypothetical protein